MFISEKLIETNGRPAGFDYLRLILATAVFLLHIVVINYGDAASGALWLSWRRPIGAIVLPAFFSLSGFLVAGSLVRSRTLIQFLGLRVIRIAPALAVEVLLCALILGPFFTTKPLSEYFADYQFHHYFLNILGDVHFLLPGVFANNPHPFVVNEQLWTIPWELRCYIFLAVLALLKIVRNRVFLCVLAILLQVAVFVHGLIFPPEVWVSVHGSILIESFIAGIVIFNFKDQIYFSAKIFWLSFILTLVLLSIPFGDYFVSFPAAYATVYLGILNPKRNRILLSGDYSYGIYLYGFPIQQAISAAVPSMRSVLIDLILALPLTCAVAVVSWWFVEKPTLGLRNYLPVIDNYLSSKFSFRKTEMTKVCDS